MFQDDDTPVASREEQSRQAVLDHYNSREGGEREDPFTLLLLIKTSPEASMSMREILETRAPYRRAGSAPDREKIRNRVLNTMTKIQRQRLVSKNGAQWEITARGRQLVIAGIHSRASTLLLGNLDIEAVCDLCSEEELPGCPVPMDKTPWPTTIAMDLTHCFSGWVRSSHGNPVGTGGMASAL
ncbi:hypothetical protein LJR189_004621 [Acidovorax delafieldii]|jgi:hypothetical protein|uniref:hypothetical protein n=1 Tax=Acidovorax delafieldii TaxID=47920 RepID=UPI003ED1609A